MTRIVNAKQGTSIFEATLTLTHKMYVKGHNKNPHTDDSVVKGEKLAGISFEELIEMTKLADAIDIFDDGTDCRIHFIEAHKVLDTLTSRFPAGKKATELNIYSKTMVEIKEHAKQIRNQKAETRALQKATPKPQTPKASLKTRKDTL